MAVTALPPTDGALGVVGGVCPTFSSVVLKRQEHEASSLEVSLSRSETIAFEQKAPQPQVRDKEYEILQLRSFTAEEWFMF